MAKSRVHGIFCLETDWWGVKSQATVEPVLQLLNSVDYLKVPYIHRDIGTREEFEHYLRKWMQKGLRRYPVLYLGFHGEERALRVGERRGRHGLVTLDDLGEMLRDACKGRVIHFGSCLTLDVHGRTLKAFVRKTGAVAIMGYREWTDWVEVSAFEVLLLGELQSLSLTKQGMVALERRVRARAPGLCKQLGFRMVVS